MADKKEDKKADDKKEDGSSHALVAPMGNEVPKKDDGVQRGVPLIKQQAKGDEFIVKDGDFNEGYKYMVARAQALGYDEWTVKNDGEKLTLSGSATKKKDDGKK